jgi:hypothetical protein
MRICCYVHRESTERNDMPRLTPTETPAQVPTVDFVFSPSLDLVNAMYFTHLVVDSEGVEGWPVQVREQLAPGTSSTSLRLPKGQPGIMGQLGDVLRPPETGQRRFAHQLRPQPALGLGQSETEARSRVSPFTSVVAFTPIRARSPGRTLAPSSARRSRAKAAMPKPCLPSTTGRRSCASVWPA